MLARNALLCLLSLSALVFAASTRTRTIISAPAAKITINNRITVKVVIALTSLRMYSSVEPIITAHVVGEDSMGIGAIDITIVVFRSGS